MSKDNAAKQAALEEPQEAIVSYLDQLLQQIPENIPDEPVVTQAETSIQPETNVVVSEAEPVVAETVVTEDTQPDPEIDETAITSQQLEVNVADAEPPMEAGIPDFAQQEFQCLVFELAGLNMAIPLEYLNGIVELNDTVTAMPGHSPWFLGILPERGMQIKVIDTAKLVVPGKYREAHSEQILQKAILISDGEWGLACHDVKEVVTLSKDDVRWRKSAGKRPWLLGTVVEEMCALLDAEEFASMLSSENCQILD